MGREDGPRNHIQNRTGGYNCIGQLEQLRAVVSALSRNPLHIHSWGQDTIADLAYRRHKSG